MSVRDKAVELLLPISKDRKKLSDTNRKRIDKFLSDIKAELKGKLKDSGTKEVSRLSVNELIPFEQTEPFKRLATILDNKVDEVVEEVFE